MKMKVVFSTETVIYLSDLIEVLYNDYYFSFKEDAKEYVEKLVRDIELSIDTSVKKKAPEYFLKYGNDLYYISCRKSKHTQWYIFFHIKDGVYYVEYIGNNHTCSHRL